MVQQWGTVEVYFRTPSWKRSVGIVTWSSFFRTHETDGSGERGVGPCSPVAELLRLHGDEVVPLRRGGRVVAYRLGRLWFRADADGRIGAAMLTKRELSPNVLLGAPACRGRADAWG